MNKRFFSLCLGAVLLCNLNALEVNKSELQNTNENSTIEFINYTGPHKIIDSLAAIKGIGSDLGKEISRSPENSSSTGNSKYSVIHAIDPNETGKLDADIIVIGTSATVDHINNLRRIISAYLVSAYNYSEADADTLSVFITVYNAVYRGKLDSFEAKYKRIVTDNLSADNCGLSVNYKDWPGKTQIVIPLYDVNGGLSTIETSVISDKSVVQSMKEDDDRNIESRKEMVDIKEREAEEAETKAQNAQKSAVEEQKKLNEEKQKTAEAKKEAETAKKDAEKAQNEADKAKKEAEEAQKKADANPDDKKAQETAAEAEVKAQESQKAADDAESKAEEAEEALEEQEQKQAEQQEKTDEAKKEAQEQQARADKKQNEAQSERKEIAKDQQIVQKQEALAAAAPVEYGIILTDEKQMLSRLVKFNSETGETLKNSPVSVIRGRTIYKTGNGYIAIAGENSGKGAVKLVLIDPDSMEITAESDFTVSENSVLVQDGTDYYCIISDGKNWAVAKSDEELTLRVKSKISVKESTPITVTENGIVITGTDGKLKLLSKDDLNETAKK